MSLKESSATSGRGKRVIQLFLALCIVGLSAGVLWFVVFEKPLPPFLQNMKISLPSRGSSPGQEIICISSTVNPVAEEALRKWLESNEGEFESGYSISSFRGAPSKECSTILSSQDYEEYDLVWRKYFILVSTNRSTIGEISQEQLDELLAGRDISVGSRTVSLIMEEETVDALDRAIGVGVGIQTEEEVADVLQENDNSVAIIPFETMKQGLKEVTIDGASLLIKSEVETYPLVEEVWLSEGDAEGLFQELKHEMGEVNYMSDKVASVVITGTSVVGSRGIYQKSIEVGDWLYAWRNVGETLRTADISHISNEASFSPDCEQYSWTMVFCGPDEAFEGLTWAGIDIVGLTGNHILDAGADAFGDTLSKYENAGIEYFGGGANYDEAHTAAVIEAGGMKFAFLGYNMIPPVEYFAEGNEPGSARLIEEDIERDIKAVREEVDFIFVDMQWGPEYERYPNSYQVQYGHAAVDAGADFVHGVHPHWIQPVEEYKEGYIFYSLGNFLFDQLWSIDTREGLMIRHYFYDGEYLGYEPVPVYLSDEMQTRVAEGADRSRILEYLYLEL